MSAYHDLIVESVRESVAAGGSAPPDRLLTDIVDAERPLEALFDFDVSNSLFDALYQDFDVLRRAQARLPVQPADVTRCAALIRWFKNAVSRWRPGDDPRQEKLTSIVVTAQALDYQNQLWPLLSGLIGRNVDLAEAFGRIVGSLAVEFAQRDMQLVPIWESEASQHLKDAEEAGDWSTIGERWMPFRQLIFPNAVQTQAVRFLFQFDRDRLVTALAGVRQTGVAMLVARTLRTEQRLEIGGESRNAFIEFASVYETLTNREPLHVPPSSEARLLAVILDKVARDEQRWIGWMRFFNAYPQRYPALQVPLGHCLANAPEHAIPAYVNSIVLSPKKPGPDQGRRSVAECLAAFRALACPERRSALWTLTHNLWADWQFDRANPATHLFEANWSDLDYAVVGYACECMDQAERDAVQDSIRHDLGQLNDQWHVSLTDMITAWNRLLSQFQPYARASQVLKTGGDWLSDSRVYLPFDPSTDMYLVMKYRSV
ncbi:MAG: hypothetical protein EPN45_09310 [Rhizobiaceae bacterium]|nr:MAG: hypothetical protein EPN45_09310 [Rhizobiaceae bacterium]